MVQCAAGKHDQWQLYMTIIVISHGIIKCICIHTAVIHLMMKCDAASPCDRFRHNVKWMLAVSLQHSTMSVLDFDHMHDPPPTLHQDTDTYRLVNVNQSIPNDQHWIKGGVDPGALAAM